MIPIPRPRLLSTVALAAILVLAAGVAALPGTTGSAHGGDQWSGSSSETAGSAPQNQPHNGSDPPGQPQDGGPPGNQTGPPGNQSNAPPGNQGGGRDDRSRAAGNDRRPVDPVTIRDHATGFRTEPPAGSLRPQVAVDAARGMASVQRADVQSLDLQFDTLIEFVDENANGRYDVGEVVLQRAGLRDVPFEVVADRANETRDLVYPLDGDGRLVLRFHLGDVPTRTAGAKFDVRIEGYPYHDETSLIALGLRVDSGGGLRSTAVGAETALAGRTGDQVPYLSWQQEVWVDGRFHPVGASVHLAVAGGDENPESAIVYWAYPQGDHIVHDPVLGVTGALKTLVGEITPFLVGLAGASVLVGIGYAARRRSRL